MGICPNCNGKTGFLNRARKCNECGREMCIKCTEWILYTPGFAAEGFKANAEVPICSPNCVLRSYRRIVQSLDRSTPLQLINADNSGIQIDAKSRKGAQSSFGVYNMKGTPQDASSDHMIPEAQRVYDMVKQLLVEEGLSFSESKETNV